MFLQVSRGQHEWDIVYDKAIRDDESLLFPERLTHDFLAEQRKTLGPYIFTNQYMNEIIPAEDQEFKDEWIKYYDTIPINHHTFAFLDPAISQQEHADYTALAVVHVDEENRYYLEVAKRFRISAVETVQLLFEVAERYNPLVIGVEDVAYQKSLLHFTADEMRKRGKYIPLQGVKRGSDKSKEIRILSLAPRFAWGGIFLNRGLTDFEDEYSKFPRGRFDDILDAVSSIEEIASPPNKERSVEREPARNSPEYEKWYIQQITNEHSGSGGGFDSY